MASSHGRRLTKQTVLIIRIYRSCQLCTRFCPTFRCQFKSRCKGNYWRSSVCILTHQLLIICRSQWPRGLRRRSTAARPLRSWVRILPGAWMFVCYECCVLSGRGLCDGLITGPEESYRLWRVVVCDPETSKMRRLKPATGL